VLSVVVRDAAALRAAVADGGGAPVVELDPAGGVFALGTEELEIERPVRLVSGAGGRATLAGGERGGMYLVRVASPGVALEGLALVAGTYTGGNQQVAVGVGPGGEAELRGCDVTGAVVVYGTAALRDCAVHDVTRRGSPAVGVDAELGAGRATLERCAIERCAGGGVRASDGGVARLVETTVRECHGDDYFTLRGGAIEGVAPGLITKR
jgi:nitrous oxidase accessory protein NosD